MPDLGVLDNAGVALIVVGTIWYAVLYMIMKIRGKW